MTEKNKNEIQQLKVWVSFQNPALSRPKADSIDYNAKKRTSLASIMTEKNENEFLKKK